MQIDKDLVAASATPLVLAILAEGESYGYAILKRVRELSEGELEWTDGMLYPLLHRLHRLGYVTTEWRDAARGRRRRYYAITDEGRAALAEHNGDGDRHARAWVTSGAAATCCPSAWVRPDHGALELEIAEWRAFVGQAPAVDGRDVEELEAHLRDQIADLERGRSCCR